MPLEQVLVLGANGYLGSHVARRLDEQGYSCVRAGTRERSEHGAGDYVRLDVREPASLEAAVAAARYVFAFAGLTGTRRSFSEAGRFVETNETGLLNVLDAVRRSRGPAKVIFPS